MLRHTISGFFFSYAHLFITSWIFRVLIGIEYRFPRISLRTTCFLFVCLFVLMSGVTVCLCHDTSALSYFLLTAWCTSTLLSLCPEPQCWIPLDLEGSQGTWDVNYCCIDSCLQTGLIDQELGTWGGFPQLCDSSTPVRQLLEHRPWRMREPVFSQVVWFFAFALCRSVLLRHL